MGAWSSKNKKPETLEFYGEPQVDRFGVRLSERVVNHLTTDELASPPPLAPPSKTKPQQQTAAAPRYLAETQTTALALRQAQELEERQNLRRPVRIFPALNVDQLEGPVLECYE